MFGEASSEGEIEFDFLIRIWEMGGAFVVKKYFQQR